MKKKRSISIWLVILLTSTLLLSSVTSFASESIEIPTVEVKKVTWNSIELTWNSIKGVEGYQIYRYDNKNNEYISIAEVEGSITSFIDKKLKSDTKYKYKIKASKLDPQDTLAYSKASKVVSGKTLTNYFFANAKKQSEFTGDELGIIVDYMEYVGDYLYVQYYIKNLSQEDILLEGMKLTVELYDKNSMKSIIKKNTLKETDFSKSLEEGLLPPGGYVYLDVYYSAKTATMNFDFKDVDANLNFKYKLK